MDRCSHCKTLEPVLEQTSEVLEGRLKIARVDGTRHRLLVAQHKIKSYPWLEYFHEGEFKQYPCSRSLQGFSTFADRMLEGEEVKRVSSKMDLKRLLDVSHVAFLLISPSSPPPSISGYQTTNHHHHLTLSGILDPFYEVAGELRGGADFGVVENYDMREDLLGLHLISRQALMIEESAFILKLEVNPDLGTTSFNLDDIHSLFFEPRVHPLTGDANYSSSALRSFVTSHNMKLVNSFDLAHHKSFHTGNRLMVCGVVDYSQPSNTYRFISRFSKAAEVAREEFGEERFVFVHMDGLALNDFVKQLFADATPPHLVVIDQENQLFYESKTAVYSSKVLFLSDSNQDHHLFVC